MATSSYTDAIIGPLPADIKRVMKQTLDYLLKNLRLGRPGDQVPAENFPAVFLQGTTPAVADTEFTIEHGLGRTPYLIIPVLPLDAVGARIVPLRVTRVSDARRVYLSSSETSAPVSIYVEG